MKLSCRLFGCLALLVTPTGVFAATPATNPAPPTSAPAQVAAPPSTNAPAATPPAAPPAPAGLTLDKYLSDLTTELKLSDSEKQEIESYYTGDGSTLQAILNNEALSPFQQAQQVSDLRDARNAKIKALLNDLDRQREFLEIEARYRVALTKLAAIGGLVATTAPATK